MTQRNVRGAYFCFEHDRAADWDWLAKWQPNVIRYMGQGSIDDPNSFDVNRVHRIHDTCPAATILLRCWDVDDNNFKAHDAMVANPKAEAKRQVEWWAKVFDRAVVAGVPRALLMAGLNNETGPEKDAALYPYTEEALDYATDLHVRLGVFVFSVGRPSLAGEGQAFDIADFERLEPLIQQNNGAIVLHEYLQPEGMYAVWTDAEGKKRNDYPYLIGRHTNWNVNVPIIIGEWGIDGLLYNRHPDPKYGNSGWRNFKDLWPPNRYADEYVECVRQANDNVIGICPFLSDFSDHKWQSFDLLDAYGEFLARKDLCVKEVGAIPPHVEPPQPPTPPQPPVKSTFAYILAPAGANLRESPITGKIIVAVPYAEQVTVLDFDPEASWLMVRYGGVTGWIKAEFLGLEPPVIDDGPTPVEPPPAPPTKPVVVPLAGEVVTRKPSNIRTAPDFDASILEVAPTGTHFVLTGDAGEFYQIKHKGGFAYVHESVVSRVDQLPPSGDNWTRSMAFIERWEGEYQNNPADKGNWTGCETGKGINKGTKYGISACSYPDLDIVNLRREEAREIYRRDYWAKSGADAQPWPLCLLVMDTSVLHGVGAAKKWLAEVGPNPYAFAAKRLRVYTKSDNWNVFGAGWTNRVADLLEEMGKT